MFWQLKEAAFIHDEMYHIEEIHNPVDYFGGIDWWGNIKYPEPDIEISFYAPEASLLPDVLWTGSLISVFSDTLLQLLMSLNIKFEAFTTRFFDRQSVEEVLLPYQVFRSLELEAAVDHENSISYFEKIPGGMVVKYYSKLVIKNNILSEFFRLENHRNMLIVSDLVKQKMEGTDIQGFEFLDLSRLDDYKVTTDKLFEQFE